MRVGFENRYLLLALCIGLVGAALGAIPVWHLPISPYPKALIMALLLLGALGCSLYVRASILRHILALYSLVEALRSGDYRLRAHSSFRNDELGRLYTSLNMLADDMQRERLGNEEARRMLNAVLSNIDVAIFVLDDTQRLMMGNKAAFNLLAMTPDDAVSRTAAALGIEALLGGDHTGEAGSGIIDYAFPAATGTWRVSVEQHIEGGHRIHLLFVDDVRAVLRAEELNAWKNLTRVLSHEVNNSLAPIASMGSTLQTMLTNVRMAPSLREDVDAALALILSRSQHLRGFIRRYSEVARLPRPNCTLFDIRVLLEDLPRLAHGARLTLVLPDTLTLFVDAVQIEQVMINLLDNARQASPDPHSPITVACREDSGLCTIQIIDEGRGIANPVNLFVPFYSTRKDGSGIGLVLSRQIAEAHGGSLHLRNRADRSGCIAELTLPIPVYARSTTVKATKAATPWPQRGGSSSRRQ